MLPSMRQYRIAVSVAVGLLLIAAAPSLARWWEAALLRHMLMQVPMLTLSGVLLGSLITRRSSSKMASEQLEGVAAVLLAAFCLTFWMLPRWLDAAVTNPSVDAAKVGSLVLLAGLPLGWGWPRLGPLARAFIWVHVISMLVALGILYLTFPDRLCNSYLISEQPALGRTMLGLAAILGLAGGARALFGVSCRHPSFASPETRGSLE